MSKIPSPAQSQGAPVAPRRHKPRGSRSASSPARSNTSLKLSSIVECKENNMGSFAVSPVGKSMLSDNTDIDMPRRKSWWKKVNHSRDILEVLDNQQPLATNNIMEEFDVEVLSQEKKNYTLDMPESSDSESISSIVIPQRKLFTQKENHHQKFGQVFGVGSRETLSQQNKTNIADKTANIGPIKLFNQGPKRSKPVFPAALLNISPDKTTTNKTKEMTADLKAPSRHLFGNRPGTKRNMFADFIVSESEDDISEVQSKMFAFALNNNPVRHSRSMSRAVREPSPTSNITTTDIEMDDWNMLPSSTMVEQQLEPALHASSPGKRSQLSKLSAALESVNTYSNTGKTANKNEEIDAEIKDNIETSQEVGNHEENQKREIEEDNRKYNKEISQNKSEAIEVEDENLTIAEDQNESQEVEDEEQHENQENEDEEKSEIEENEAEQNESAVLEKSYEDVEKVQSENQEFEKQEYVEEHNKSHVVYDSNEKEEVEIENVEVDEQDDFEEQNEYQESDEEEEANEDIENEEHEDSEGNEDEQNESQELEEQEAEDHDSENEIEQDDDVIDDSEEAEIENAQDDQKLVYEDDEDQNYDEQNDEEQSEGEPNDAEQIDDEQNNKVQNYVNRQTETKSDTPGVSHDTTGRNRKKQSSMASPEAILLNMSNEMDTFTAKGRNTSIRKTKSILENFTIRPSLAPPRASTGLSDGTKNSSAEGSGWDSHRTTRKTLRQTFGKDFTPRKSLRTLVLEKSAKRQTIPDASNANLRQANSTELPPNKSDRQDIQVDEDQIDYEEDAQEVEESTHEISKSTRLKTLEMHILKIKKINMERKLKAEERVLNWYKTKDKPLKDSLKFRVPAKLRYPNAKPLKSVSTASKVKRIRSDLISLEDLPPELIEDMKYKPPKRFRPRNASWITKRLYKFLEGKLEPRYDYKARVRAEELVEMMYNFVRDTRRDRIAPLHRVDELKKEMARLNIVKSHAEFYHFVYEYLPNEVAPKVIPDIVNMIPIPKDGVYSDIIFS